MAELENAAPGDMDLHGDADAMNWAVRFASKVTLGDPDPGCVPLHFADRPVYTADEVRDLMLPWFASAIETGRMAEAARAAAEQSAARPTLPEDGPLLTEHHHVADRQMEQAVGEAVGLASVCWIPMDCTGVFDAATAARLVGEVMDVCRRYAECWRADSPKTPPGCDDPADPGGSLITIDPAPHEAEGPLPADGALPLRADPPGSSGQVAVSDADPPMVAGPFWGPLPPPGGRDEDDTRPTMIRGDGSTFQ